MARNLSTCEQTEEEYIDMDISTSTTFFSYSPQSRDFEFHMSSTLHEREPTTSPADELFYKGKLLPLHLPPRLQMVEKLLQTPNSTHEQSLDSFQANQQHFITASSNTTPFQSCNISPSGSCPVSREIDPEEYFQECGLHQGMVFIDHPKKSWSKKLKLIKHSSLGLKLKASRAYLKSLFTKSGCSDESCTDAARNGDEFAASKAKEPLNKYMKLGKRNPFGQIQRERFQVAPAVLSTTVLKEIITEENGGQRRSFSSAINRNLGTKSLFSSSSTSSSSSLSSGGSNVFSGLQLLKRSSSANSEVESSIQGAIAHCKQSQQLLCARKSVSDVGFCSLSASRIAACDSKEGPRMCRG